MEFAYNNSYQPAIGTLPFEALYGKSCKSPVCQGEVGERKLLGPELVQTTNEALQKIRACMQQSQSRQKSYADVRHKDLEFEIGLKVFLKSGTHERYYEVWQEGKLSLMFIGPFEVLEKYVTDLTHVVDYEPLQLNDNLSYEEKPIEILAREVKTLRHRKIAFVRVLWQNHTVREATCEREDEMKVQYSELFQG
ncbi:uncharacterized protein LOC120070114 [Benincasa hispida]|uniref:uncharacterized protein LOC120070114 n=1 Tax=Benincasa hispida TaxID=102211 RepID=UPI0019029264|nr:uncharacterized protein LOC120070114 [Benincasa hispida]